MTEHIAILICALLLDAVFGEPRWLWDRLPHPAILMGRGLAYMEKAIYANNRVNGGAVLLTCVSLAIGFGWALSLLGPLVEILVGAILLAQRSLVQHVQQVASDLRMSLTSARRSVGMIVSRDTADMEEPDVARAAIESAAENLSDGVIAPAFWCLVGGLPGILAYKMVNTADSMIGYRTQKYEQFGWAAAKLDDVMNWVPARLTSFAFWGVGGLQGRWGEIAADARRHKSPNAGWPEAALARSLNIALAGPRPYHGQMQDLPWVNERGERNISATQIERAVQQLWRVWASLVIVLCVLFLLS